MQAKNPDPNRNNLLTKKPNPSPNNLQIGNLKYATI